MQRAVLLRLLTGRAETLVERLARSVGVGLGHSGGPFPLQLNPWLKVYARGRPAALERRLQWDGWTPGQAAAAFGGRGLQDAAAWTVELQQYADAARILCQCRRENTSQWIEGWRQRLGEMPFLELWLPWLERATTSLDGLCEGLTGSAVVDLQARLLKEIATLSELAAYHRFEIFRRRWAHPGEGSQGGLYERFVDWVLQDPLDRLYRFYPTLSRQTAETVGQWQEASRELLQRYAADHSAIIREFGSGQDLGKISGFETGLSDRHGGGRQVVRLHLQSGLRLIYKPRSVGLESAFERWLAWCREEGFEWTPRAPRVVERAGYGWVENIGQSGIESAQDAGPYFRRAGALVAFAHLLRARDLHTENLVATRDGPVVIDAEMFLQPLSAAPGAAAGGQDPGNPDSLGSCLETGLLLEPASGANGEPRERAGLRSVLSYRGAERRWLHVGEDQMTVAAGVAEARYQSNVLWIGKVTARLEDYVEEIVEGFESACKFLLARKGALLAAGGPVDYFRGREVRILLRPSQDYGRVLALMSTPRNQRSGLSPSLLCEALLAGFADSEERPLVWPLVADERAALLARDIPRFALSAESSALTTASGETVKGYFRGSGLAAIRRQIETLDERQISRQVQLLRASLAEPETLAFLSPTENWQWPPEDCRGEVLAGMARSIASVLNERLREIRISGWRDLELGRGVLGMALFLAAVERSGGPRFGDQIEHVRELLSRNLGGQLADPIGAGGFSGLGSLIYGLCWLDRLGGDSDLLQLARVAASRLEPAVIGEDQAFDLESGAAGGLLGLLALYETSGEGRWLERARCCGDHLLEHQQVLAAGGAAWRNGQGLALAGWAHGSAGIARALAALATVTGDPRYRQAVMAALTHERSMFDDERGNWPALTAVSGQVRRSWLIAWCHGAPGIALSRLMLHSAFADDALEAELRSALDSTLSASPARLDHLCCGNLGRSAVLLHAGHLCNRPELLAAADRYAAIVLQRAHRAGCFSLRTDRLASRRLPLGLLKGLAGIGYQLLALSAAEVPNVLALELPGEAEQRWRARR